eukprot:3942957-Lingulodinium_polyedra.AAC.1
MRVRVDEEVLGDRVQDEEDNLRAYAEEAIVQQSGLAAVTPTRPIGGSSGVEQLQYWVQTSANICQRIWP